MGGRPEITEAQKREIVERWAAGMSAATIAEAMGLHPNTVQKHVGRHLDDNTTQSKVNRAREMFLNGATIMQVVRECEITSSRAKSIKKSIAMGGRPSDPSVATSVWRLHRRGMPASRIDRELGINNSREVISYEWKMDRLGKPSLVGSRV